MFLSQIYSVKGTFIFVCLFQRYFLLEKGILYYGKTPSDVSPAGVATKLFVDITSVMLSPNTVTSFLFVGHLLVCISWVWQSMNLRSQ